MKRALDTALLQALERSTCALTALLFIHQLLCGAMSQYPVRYLMYISSLNISRTPWADESVHIPTA